MKIDLSNYLMNGLSTMQLLQIKLFRDGKWSEDKNRARCLTTPHQLVSDIVSYKPLGGGGGKLS
jgi:hypothetical protein